MFKNVIALVILALSLVSTRGTELDTTLDQAREVLKSTQPNSFAVAIGSVIKTPANLEKQKIYDEQWAAILRLAQDPKSEGSADIALLVPYLGYGGGWGSASFGKPDLEQTKRCIPAFSAILENPNAKSALANYCLDSHNETRYRLVAFLVLRYVDLDTFQTIAPEMNNQLASRSENIKQYLSDVEKQRIYFSGDIPSFK